MDDSYNNRENIKELLELLSSKEEQLEYEKNVPFVDITVELVSMWFDDEYNPSREKIIQFCFSKEEIAILNDFHSFYESEFNKLPDSKGTIETWLANPHWLNIMKKANDTLIKIYM